jgi:prepilin-type processing-associated H-X9-DG protein
MGALEQANRAMCHSNLAQIGKAMEIYASDHRQVWPDVFTEESTAWDDVGNTRTDEWDPVTGKGRPPKAEPGDNGKPVQSNTANLWLLFAETGISPEIFICPETNQKPDVLVTDPKAVRDFRGETFVGYSFQNVLGEYTLTWTSGRAATMAVAADANPQRRDFFRATTASGTKLSTDGLTDLKLLEKPTFRGQEEHIQEWNKTLSGKNITDAWELNSPNHGFKGQNVLYLDGHIEWKSHPYCGPNWDNIWLRRRTDVSVQIDPMHIETLRAYNDVTSYDGKSTLPADSTGDSFLVP